MFDFLSNQVASIIAARRPGGMDGLPAESRRLPELEVAKAPVARGAVAEDQVFLSGGAPPPSAPIPLKPSEPTEAENRVGDVLRRPRDSRRKPASKSSDPSDDPPDDAPADQPTGHRFDRWA